MAERRTTKDVLSTMKQHDEISAAQVKELRDKTGAPMMDCKQALTEAKGDMEQPLSCCARREFPWPQRRQPA